MNNLETRGETAARIISAVPGGMVCFAGLGEVLSGFINSSPLLENLGEHLPNVGIAAPYLGAALFASGLLGVLAGDRAVGKAAYDIQMEQLEILPKEQLKEIVEEGKPHMITPTTKDWILGTLRNLL